MNLKLISVEFLNVYSIFILVLIVGTLAAEVIIEYRQAVKAKERNREVI